MYPLTTTRIALCIEYDGSAFNGWQVQQSASVSTVQFALEQALSEIADHPVKVFCAGRTDTGVHACAQIVHFDSCSDRPLKAWVKGTNTLLPDDISVIWAKEVSSEFHARFSATARRYRYIIFNHPVKPAILRNLVTSVRQPLDAEAMHEAGQYLLGELDFTSYRGASCQSPTAMRRVVHLNVSRKDDFVIIDIKANAFLLHMVRNIAGVLIEVGGGRKQPAWAKEVMEKKDRSKGAVTAPPNGLFLVDVDYPEKYELPKTKPGPSFLPA